MIVDRMTRGNILATIKELRKVKRPCARVVPVSVQAFVPESRKSKTPDRLSVISHRRSILLGGVNNPHSFSENDKFLLERLTTLHDFRMPYDGEQHGELFIHWFYRDRTVDRLSRCEIFHLNMLQYFNVLDREEIIHIRCAARGAMTGAMKKAIDILSSGEARVDFKIVSQKKSWEHDTFKECVEYAVETGKFVYYTHFKGVSRIVDDIFADRLVRYKYGELDVLYWSYILYKSLFLDFSASGILASIIKDGCNKSYRLNKYDCSWTLNKKTPNHHYAGSFQAFDGSLLAKRFDTLGVSRLARDSLLWVNDSYTVEMFLSLCNLPTEVSFSHIGIGLSSYDLYTNRQYRDSLHRFVNLYQLPKVEVTAGKFVVLTYLFGPHTMLREPQYIDAGVEYVCITDRRDVSSKHWKIVRWSLPYLQDDRLRVAYIKFHPFEFVNADKVLVLDASYHICDSILPLFTETNSPIMLLPHLYRSRIKEELDVWVKLGRMSVSQAKWFKAIVPYIGGTLEEPLYELSASVWSNCEMARRLGIETYAIVEYNGFPSNQMPCSILASRHFKDFVGSISSESMKGLKKYKHNTWELCRKQSYNG